MKSNMDTKQIIFGLAAIIAVTFLLSSCKSKSNSADKQQTVQDTDSLKAVFQSDADIFHADARGEIEVSIYCIGHATMAICADGKWLYIDANTSILKPGTDYSSMPKADYMLFTHSHGDHFDRKAVELLSQESTQIVANPETAGTLGYGNVLRNGESFTTAECWTIDAVPAYNTSADKLQFHPQGRDNGYILTIGDLRIYIAGDTENIPEMADVKDIDIAFLPCNLPYTMTPQQCAEAAVTIMPKILFPYHYSDTEIGQVAELLDGTGIDVRIRLYQ